MVTDGGQKIIAMPSVVDIRPGATNRMREAISEHLLLAGVDASKLGQLNCRQRELSFSCFKRISRLLKRGVQRRQPSNAD